MTRLISILLLSVTVPVYGATYFIDYATGNDANNGTSKATPFKRHPYMVGFTGAYVHAAGDRFIFKGGVTWPNACFTMNVLAGGNPTNPDYYGVDTTWYTGGSFARPIFDAGSAELAGGYDVMVLCNLANAPHDITFDNLDLRNLFWTGPKAFSQVAFFNLSVSSNIVVGNCWIHNWTHGTLAAATADTLKVIIGSNSSPFNPGCSIQNCLIDGENTSNTTLGQASGEATYAYSGNIINTTVKNMASGLIVTGPAVPLALAQVVSGCEIGPLYNSFDPAAHPDGLFMNGGNLFHWHDNFIHDCPTLSVFSGEGSGNEDVYLWNNVIWNGRPIEIDNTYSGARMWFWNNTIVGGSFNCVRVINRGHGPLGTLDARNNLFITDASAIALDAGASINHYTNANNVTLSVGVAAVQGYSAANRYQPTSVTAPTVNTGQDLADAWRVVPGFPVSTNGSFPRHGSSADALAWHGFYRNLAGDSQLISTDKRTVVQAPLTAPSGIVFPDDVAFQSNTLAVIEVPGNGVHVKRFSATSSLPTSVTFQDEVIFGDSDSRGGGILFTASGGLICTWNQQSYVVTNGVTAISIGIAYLPPGGTTNDWKIHWPLIEGTVSGLTSLVDWPIAQNPSDGSVWSFYKRDSYHWMEAVRSVESGSDVVVTPFPKTLDEAVYGEYGVEGELPFQFATSDAKTGCVVLAYQRNKFQIFSPVPFLKGAYIGLAFIKGDGSILKFGSVDNYTERETPFCVMGDNQGHFNIAYQTISASGVNFDLLQSYYDGVTTNAISTNMVEQNTYFFNSDTRAKGGGFYRGLYGGIWKLLTAPTDILGSTRPQGSSWDVGAYELAAAPAGDPGTLALSTDAASVGEGGGFIGISVVRSGGTLGAVSVTASTADGTAIAGHDYTSTSTALNWADGTSGARSFSVPILNSGDTATTNRTFTVNLSAATGATIGTPSTETVTIVMNPPIPPQPTNAGTFTDLNVTASVSLTGGSVSIGVSRTGSTNIGAALSYYTVDGTAKAGVDYTTSTGTLTWAVNENTTKTVTVPIINTAKVGGQLWFNLVLHDPTNGAAINGPNTSTVSILLNPPISAPNGVKLVGSIRVVGLVKIALQP